MKKVNAYIKKIIARIYASSFVKSVLTLSAGVIVSQAVALGTTPIISRIYNPQILGDFTIITSNSTIIGTIICMGFLSTILLPDDDDEAKGLCRLLLKLILGGTTILLVGGLAVSECWKMFNVSISYPAACVMLWALVIFTNISAVLYSYVNRQKLYKVLFWNPTIGTMTYSVIGIILGLMGCGLWGYLWSRVISNVLVILHMLRHANPFCGKIEYKSLQLVKKYRDFPLVLLPSNLLGTVSLQLPVLLLDRFWGSFTLGSYSMCMTILNLPSSFLAGPVNRVFYREATERINRGENIGEFSFSLMKANIKIALIPIMILIILGRPLFAIVLGEEWAEAGDFASIMSFYVLMSFCTSCLAGKFVIIGKKQTILYLNILVLITNLLVFLVSYWLELSGIAAVCAYSVVGGLVSLLDMAVFMKQTNISLKRFCYFSLQYLLMPMVLGGMANLVFRQWFLTIG